MSAQTPTIRLQGTWRRPELIATFAPYDRHPQRPGRTLLDFIKSLPGRRFEKKHLHWVITGIGTDPVGKFVRAGFALDPASFTGDFSHFTGLDDLEELAEPVTHLTSCGGELFIRPRFTGYTIVAEMLGHTAIWDSKRDMFRLPIGDLIIDGEPIAGLPVSEEAIAAAWKKRSARVSSPSVRASAAALAQVTDVSAAADDHAAIVEHLGDVPDWFGLDLFAYQRAGALAAAAGHSFIADEPGLGKCVVPDTGVHTGGDIVPIGQLWRERAERAYADPDGDAGELIDLKAGELPVISLDAETGEAVQAHASHLYRQRYRGLVHTITLSNGRSLSCTPRHRVWTPAGWMRADELAAGDYIGTAMRHTALETARAIRTGRCIVEAESEPRNRWTTETLNAPLHVDVALVEQVETDLQKMLSEPVRWHEIVSITTSDYDGYVYDLSVPGTRSYIAEGMWTHNTRQALAAAAILAPRRILIVAPPVALTNWAKQTSQSGVAAAAELLAHEGPPARSSVTAAPRRPAASAGQHATTIFSGNGEFTLTGGYTASESTPGQTGVVVVTPGRKTPPLPDAGCVIVADSTLTSRPALLDELCQWAPEVLIDDEIHRHKNPAAQRTQALVRLSAATKTSVIGLSGTPMLKNPDQLLSQLDITGHLYPVLGSYRQAMHTYCRRREINGYSTWQPRAKALPKLGQILAEQVWVRRTKQQVLPDLPKKLRRLGWVDVDLQSYKRAHEDVLGGIADAAEDVYRQSRRWPSTRRELLDIAGDPFTVLAPLRKAAGLAKVPAAIDWILDHLNAHGDTADFDRPLIVWTHHREVAEQLSAGIADSAPNTRVETILGGMSRRARDRVVADFQNGQVGVLIASITAANVAITLTRSCDVLVVEVDWNPANISQAEDRAARIGQDRPVTVTTLAAADTIDERMHKALQDTAKTLAPVLIDGDTAVSKAQQSEVKSATQLLADLAARAVAGRKRRLKRRDDHAEKPARRRAKPVTA